MRSLKELISLKDRVALVTGGAGHIGLAMGEAMAELGASIAVLDLRNAECESAAGHLQAEYGVASLPLPIDLSDVEAVRLAPQKVVDHFGRLDILVHSAAYTDTSVPGWAVPFDQQSVGAWDKAMRINTTSAFVLVQAARQGLAVSGHGSVIFISSIYGLVGPDMRLYEGTEMNNAAGYAATKGGLLQLMRYLATLLAPQIRVNAVSPGGVGRNQADLFRERYESRTPLQRMATEEDLKGAIAYLASDLSNYVTGHNLVVDGGWTTW